MSFKSMTVKDLREVAEMFEVDVAGMSKTDTISTLEAEGVTYESYVAFSQKEKVSPESEGYVTKDVNNVSSADIVLVKMERQNPSYQVKTLSKTYSFTSRHPFVPMDADDADFLFDHEFGFRIATPKEVKQYYG